MLLFITLYIMKTSRERLNKDLSISYMYKLTI